MFNRSTLRDLWRDCEQALREEWPGDAHRDARLILTKLLGGDGAAFYARLDQPVEDVDEARLEEMLALRNQGMPLQYIWGEQEFYGLKFKVGLGVLIPRPETEHLVDYALSLYPRDAELRLADLGCGSGAIAVSVALGYVQAHIEAIDISPAALSWARINVEEYGLGERIALRQGDMASSLRGEYDLLLSNPPYIARDELMTLAADVRREPLNALDGGADGLDYYRLLARVARRHLAPQGQIVLEIGCGQKEAVTALLAAAGLRIEAAIDDLAGIPRVLAASKVSGFPVR